MFAVGCIASLAGKVHGHPSRSSSRQDNRPAPGRRAPGPAARRAGGGATEAEPGRAAAGRLAIAVASFSLSARDRAPGRSARHSSRQSETGPIGQSRSFRQICTHRISPIISNYGRTQQPARSPTHTWQAGMTPCRTTGAVRGQTCRGSVRARARGEPATFRRPARLVIRAIGPGHDLWGREVHIIILSTPRACPIAPQVLEARAVAPRRARISDPISRRQPQAPRAIQYHSHLHLTGLTHMRGGTGLLPQSLPKPAHTDARAHPPTPLPIP